MNVKGTCENFAKYSKYSNFFERIEQNKKKFLKKEIIANVQILKSR